MCNTGVSAGDVGVGFYHGDKFLAVINLIVKVSEDKTTNIELVSVTGPYLNGVPGVVGNYMQVTAVGRSKGRNNEVTITSSNSSVVSVKHLSTDSDNWCTFKLSFVGAGKSEITITSIDGFKATYNIQVNSNYKCYPGDGLLTPEEWANAQTQVFAEIGFTISYGATGYLVCTCRDDQLTWYNARACAESLAHDWWRVGIRHTRVEYIGRNENGLHVFYQYR